MFLPNEITLIDLFSGTGGFAKGLLDAGYKIKTHFFSEVDKYCIANYQYNFPNAINIGDIKKIKGREIQKPDLLTFGSPCQDISVAGKRKGIRGRKSNLFFEAVRIIRETKPRVFIFENVKGIFSSNKGKDFEVVLKAIADLGIYECQWQLLNTSWFLPQNRERLYLIGHLREESRPEIFPFNKSHQGAYAFTKEGKEKQGLMPTIDTKVGDSTHRSPYVLHWKGSASKWKYNRMKNSPTLNTQTDYVRQPLILAKNKRTTDKKFAVAHYGHKNKAPKISDLMPTLKAQSHGHEPMVKDAFGLRRLTPVECERLQGFPDEWTRFGIFDNEIKEISDTQRYTMLGNAVSVVVVKAIGKRLLKNNKQSRSKRTQLLLQTSQFGSIPKKNSAMNKKKYDTLEKRLKFVKKKGNLITFKKPFRWMGEDFTQLVTNGIQKQQGSLQIIGFNRDSNWYKGWDELIDSIDWDKMEEWHSNSKNLGISPKLYPERPEFILGEIGSLADIDIPEINIIYDKEVKKKFLNKITSSADVSEILRELYPSGELQLQEQFIILYLNSGNKILGYYRHSKGGIDSTVVDIRLVMSVALKAGAVSMILSHNHPSGSVQPSPADKIITKKVKEAAELFDITLLDHVIITKEEYFSFGDDGLLGIEPELLPDYALPFINALKDRIERGIKDNKISLEKLAATFKITDKTVVKELIELTIVDLARSIASQHHLSITERYKQIVRLYENQVNLSHRTSQSILLQQYSTPAPIGFLAGLFCEIDSFKYNNKTGFEPSAGNGLLTIASDAKNFIVNEIDNVRNLNLVVQGYKNVSRVDASEDFTKTLGKEFHRKFDAVITNPPFGKAGVIKLFDGYAISTLEHLMAIRGLNTMKDEGKAAIIIGGHTVYDEKGRVQQGANRIFLNYLYSHYYVADIIPIDGKKLYSRQGTGFNVRLILIDGRKPKPEGAAPVFDDLPENGNKTYIYEDVEYSESELIELANSTSTYDKWKPGSGPVITIEDAIRLLKGVKTKKVKSAGSKKKYYSEKPVSRFDELYDRVMEAMKFSHRLTYKKEVKEEEEMNANPEVKLAFQAYYHFKSKNNDVLALVGIQENYYSFDIDALNLYDILGLPVSGYRDGETPVPYIKFPRENLDWYLAKIMQRGHKVAIIDELQAKSKKIKPVSDDINQAFKDLEDEMKDELKKLDDDEDLGAPYQPASEGCIVLNTVVPDSMEYETRQALEFVKKEVGGSIDEFVRQRLGYPSKMDLCKALSAEQTDAVALAIYNIEARGQGMIIGDQTGIGKGRIAAAMIRYSVLQGHKPIFITEKPNLFSDIYRDLIAIGSGHLVPFIVNAKESKTDIKDEEGNILHQALSSPEQQVFFEEKRIPGNCDFVLATYTQFNSPERKPTKPQFLIAVAKGNNIIMDESHNASGSSQTGEFLQNIVYESNGVVFLSATFAKRPDNMPLYAMKTAIRDANMNKEDLIFAIQKGGVALQEILASQLVKEGQMLRRERSFEGIEVNYLMLDTLETEHRAIADNITEVLREIIAFQTNTVDAMVDELDDIAVAEGKEVNIREGTSQAGVDNLPYFSKVFQVINQMLFAIKADAVADQAIKRLKEGKKPVIAFSSTMGSFIEQMENEKGLPVTDGDVINIDFSEVLTRGLDGVLRYTETQADGTKEFKKFDLTELSEPAREEYLRIASKIKEMSSGICISPIDLILQKLKAAGYKVAEVTGRKFEVQLNLKTQKGMVQSRKKVNTNDAFRQFNNNEIDVLMINQSGSTGASAHAIVTNKVSASQVKQRVMIVLQAELNINTEVQKRGRINRTGQILLPVYDYNMSAIPAEKRLMMMLQKKLKSLDANTTSNQKQSTKILDVPDFLNKYGDKIVTQYLNENPEINKLLGDPLRLSDPDNEDADILEDAAHKVSGRVAVLSTKMQEEFYNEVSQGYNDYVEYLKQIGEYDLEVETMNLEAETISTKVVRMGKGGDSEFGTDSILEMVKANVLKKPFKRPELENILKEALGNRNPEKIQEEILNEYEIYAKETLENDIAKEKQHYSEQIENIPNEKKAIKLKEIAVHAEYLKFIAKREKELNEAKDKQIEKLQTQMQNRSQYLSRIFKFFSIGKNLLYPVGSFSEGDIKVKAVFLGFVIDKKKKNPYAPSNIRLRFALASSNKYIVMPASYAEDINGIIGASYDIPSNDTETTLTEWEEAIKAADVSKNTRYIISGNLLQAFAGYKGKLVSYTTSSGETKKGILMPEYWEGEEEMEEKIAVPVARALKVIASTIKGNAVTTDNGTAIFNMGDTYKIVVPASRQKGGEVFLDPDILNLVVNHNFEKTSDKMVAHLPHKKLSELLNILQTKFNDSIKIQSYQFDLISDEGNQVKARNPIKLLSAEEVAEQEELVLLALSVEVEMEMELELLKLQNAA